MNFHFCSTTNARSNDDDDPGRGAHGPVGVRAMSPTADAPLLRSRPRSTSLSTVSNFDRFTILILIHALIIGVSFVSGFSPEMTTRKKGPVVLFDFDGTTAETEPMILKASNRTLKPFGIEWTEGEYKGLLKVGNTEARLCHWFDRHGWPDAATKDEAMRSNFVKELKREKDRHFDILLQEASANGEFTFRPGVLEVMEAALLELQGKVAIVSNTNTNVVRKQWRVLVESSSGNRHYLLDSVRIFGGDLAPDGKKKPHPGLYLHAAAEMGALVDDCVVFEDTNEGLSAALQAGISNVVITKNFYSKDDSFQGAKLVLDDLKGFMLEKFLKEQSWFDNETIKTE